MTNEGEQLHNIVRWRRGRRADKTVPLGDAVRELMDSRISPQQAIFSSVSEVWAHLLPAGLGEHCEITGIIGGELKVQVDSPAYLYELKLCSPELVDELQSRCPKARIKGIKFVLA